MRVRLPGRMQLRDRLLYRRGGRIVNADRPPPPELFLRVLEPDELQRDARRFRLADRNQCAIAESGLRIAAG